MGSALGDLDATRVDVVALGKAAGEMASAASTILMSRIQRVLVVTDDAGAAHAPEGARVEVGEHPVPGVASQRAGAALLEFLAAGDDTTMTLFLISGGASSLCVALVDPVTLHDARAIWRLAVEAGFDITSLNELRASTSAIAGGAVLRLVRGERARALVMVDNVISGVRWVASGLTFDSRPSSRDVAALLGRFVEIDPDLRARVLRAAASRTQALDRSEGRPCATSVLVEPARALDAVINEATRRGYRVVDMGAAVCGDVGDVASTWSRRVLDEAAPGDHVCVVGVGEVTSRVLADDGLGGRCQQFAWSMADVLAASGRECVAMATSTDGRDFVEGVGGAWADETTIERAVAAGLDWREIRDRHDTNRGHQTLGQLLEGGHTGWNLCDVYLVLL